MVQCTKFFIFIPYSGLPESPSPTEALMPHVYVIVISLGVMCTLSFAVAIISVFFMLCKINHKLKRKEKEVKCCKLSITYTYACTQYYYCHNNNLLAGLLLLLLYRF